MTRAPAGNFLLERSGTTRSSGAPPGYRWHPDRETQLRPPSIGEPPAIAAARADYPNIDDRMLRLEAVRRMIGVMVDDVLAETEHRLKSHRIETPEDVKRYITELEKKLLGALEDDTVIHIEF